VLEADLWMAGGATALPLRLTMETLPTQHLRFRLHVPLQLVLVARRAPLHHQPHRPWKAATPTSMKVTARMISGTT